MFFGVRSGRLKLAMFRQRQAEWLHLQFKNTPNLININRLAAGERVCGQPGGLLGYVAGRPAARQDATRPRPRARTADWGAPADVPLDGFARQTRAFVYPPRPAAPPAG